MEEENRTKNNKKFIIGIIVLLVFIICIVSVGFVISKNNTKNNEKQETKENKQEKNTLDTEEIEIEEDDQPVTPKPEEKEQIALKDYDGYWFRIDDLKDYVAVHDIKENSLTFDIFLYRLYSMEKIKVKIDSEGVGKFKYKDEGIAVEGTIKFNNKEVKLDITKSNFEYIKKGEKLTFNVQMKKQAFEEHMLKIAEAENNE